MSTVWNYLLMFSLTEDEDAWPTRRSNVVSHEVIHELNRRLAETQGGEERFLQLDTHCGGVKACEANIYGAALNCFSTAELVPLLRKLCWIEPTMVQLFVKRPESEVWVEEKMRWE